MQIINEAGTYYSRFAYQRVQSESSHILVASLSFEFNDVLNE
jgi:hypothetical protein